MCWASVITQLCFSGGYYRMELACDWHARMQASNVSDERDVGIPPVCTATYSSAPGHVPCAQEVRAYHELDAWTPGQALCKD